MVNLTYHGHACFTLEADGYRTVLDPYKHGMVDGLPELDLEAEAVYCSHGHADHNFVEAVKLRASKRDAPYTLEILESVHDDQGGTLRGKNLVHVFTFGCLRIAHMGDQGCIPEGQLLEALKGVDCLLIPVGGTFTIDPAAAKETIDKISPKVAIPMHYRTDSVGFDVLHHLKDFTSQFADVKTCDNTVTLTKETQRQILVVNYKP